MVTLNINWMLKLSEPSLTDWVQAFGVVIAAVGFIFTFRQQRKATWAQVEATNSQLQIGKRDYLRYLKEIEPRLNFNFDDDPEGGLQLRIDVNNADAFNFRIIPENEQAVKVSRYHLEPKSILKLTTRFFDFQVLDESLVEQNSFIVAGAFNFTAEFFDAIGNRYQQKFTIYGHYEGFYNSFPIFTSFEDLNSN